ncbi:MAG: hypothetical protein GX230_09535 [Lentisphaerae bacterium]|nr:hypothetical protein [Lentisphaerota bacterium]
MRNFLVKFGLGAAMLLVVCGNAAAQAALPNEAVQARDNLAVEAVRAKLQFDDARSAMPNGYITQLAALKRKYQQQGDLDGTLAVIKEAKRFTEARDGGGDVFDVVPELPTEALVKEPEELRKLQETYLRVISERSEALNKQLEERVSNLVTQLDTLVRELTRQNRIEEALAVRAEGDEWRRALDNGSAGEAAERLAAKLPSATRRELGEQQNSGRVREFGVSDTTWRSWKLDRIASYAQEGILFAHPDLPDELVMTYDEPAGELRVQGVCAVAQAPIDMRERTWFGKAARWFVPSPEHLQATFTVTSQGLARNKDSGPSLQIVVQSSKGRHQVYSQALMYREITLRLEYDKETGSNRIVWVQGQTAAPINLPANAGPLRLLLTVTVCQLGERCDTTITVK